MTSCRHTTLQFGSGGYYVFCSMPGCGASWIAWKVGEDENVPGVQKGQPACGVGVLGARCESNICGECKGSGEIGLADGNVPCPVCGGSGNPSKAGPFGSTLTRT